MVVREANDPTLLISSTNEEASLLINGALEVLERKRIDEGVVNQRGVWFWAKLKGRRPS